MSNLRNQIRSLRQRLDREPLDPAEVCRAMRGEPAGSAFHPRAAAYAEAVEGLLTAIDATVVDEEQP